MAFIKNDFLDFLGLFTQPHAPMANGLKLPEASNPDIVVSIAEAVDAEAHRRATSNN